MDVGSGSPAAFPDRVCGHGELGGSCSGADPLPHSPAATGKPGLHLCVFRLFCTFLASGNQQADAGDKKQKDFEIAEEYEKLDNQIWGAESKEGIEMQMIEGRDRDGK